MSKNNVFSPPALKWDFKRLLALTLLLCAFSAFSLEAKAQEEAPECIGCVGSDCTAAAPLIPPFHNSPYIPGAGPFLPGEDYILAVDLPTGPGGGVGGLGGGTIGWLANFRKYRTWLTTNDENLNDSYPPFFRNQYLNGLTVFAEQMSAVAFEQAMMIGKIFDAKHQLETQRLLQELQVQARKDYQPSEELCVFGTGVRSMAPSEHAADEGKLQLGEMQRHRHLGHGEGNNSDARDRWGRFKNNYCDPKDNNWSARLTGLATACGSETPPNVKKTNLDIDYTRLVEEPRTIGDGSVGDISDVFALSSNLYGNKALSRDATERLLTRTANQHLYMALRSVAAKRSVAENSFNSIVGMKLSGTSNKRDDPNATPKKPGTAKFLGALMVDLGVPLKEVYTMLGDNPSYYAQLEILAKKMYENPEFYSNLYDTPANVLRKSASLKAFELIVDRETFESELRQEMLMSVLLAAQQNERFLSVNDDMLSINEAAKR